MCLYEVLESEWNGRAVIKLIDLKGEAKAYVMPDMGNNLFHLSFGQYSVLLEPPDTEDLASFSSKFGVPVLFPPNRIRNGRFTLGNREYQLPQNEGEDHIHGEIRHRPWKVIRHGVNETWGAFVTSEFKLVDCPEMFEYFPHRLVFRMTYSLKNSRLSLIGEIENMDEHDAPLFLGFHPYFSYPEGHADDIVLSIPAKREWKVNESGYVEAQYDETELCAKLRKGLRLGDFPARKGYRLFEVDGSEACCEVVNKKSGFGTRFTVSHSFPFIVLFRPLWASAISLEPYSCLTDVYNLSLIDREIPVTNLRGFEIFKYSFTLEPVSRSK
ncbi:MAG: aldose 1-epimerase [Paenibacillus sp.]|jgi:aldose 1-epimerase|nr:aldose 1-epimerase [Paenibacillus sp.]